MKNFLRNIGFDEETIEEILELVDNEIDAKELYKKIQYLQQLNCDARIIRIVIEENILFLTTELEEMEKVISFIKEKGLEEYIVNILEVNPDIISVSVEILRRNEKLFAMMIPEEQLKILLRDRIEILTYNSDYLADRLAFFVKNGFKNKIAKIILTQIELFDLEEEEIEIENLKKNL